MTINELEKLLDELDDKKRSLEVAEAKAIQKYIKNCGLKRGMEVNVTKVGGKQTRKLRIVDAWNGIRFGMYQHNYDPERNLTFRLENKYGDPIYLDMIKVEKA